MNHLYRYTFFLALLSLVSAPAESDTARILEDYGKIPLAFTVNQGQLDSRVRFTTSGSGCEMFFTPEGTTFLLSRETAESVAKRAARKSVVFKPASGAEPEPEIEREAFALKVAFVGANDNPEVSGEDRLPWNNNYFIGNDPAKWRTDVPNYSKVRLKEVYSGVDLVYYGSKDRIKYDFVVKPGEDPSLIALRYDLGKNGGNALSINEKGELVVKTPLGEVIERKPYCYQRFDGKEVEVAAAYRIIDAAANTFGFELGAYDTERDLSIDPEVVYSTFFGGRLQDTAYGIAVDGSGNAYVVGDTMSSDYPVTSGAFDSRFIGNGKGFVMKLNANGTSLAYSTFLGGDVYGIAIDDSGNAYVAGGVSSADYPVTNGAFDTSFNGFADVFVTKLNSTGNALVYSTFLGGSLTEYGNGIAVDASGNAYVVGSTGSSDYPATNGALDTSYNGNTMDSPVSDAFVTKLNASGSALIYSTFLGGNSEDQGFDIAIDHSGNAYVTGWTYSPTYPVTSGAFDTGFPERSIKAFVTKLDISGSALVYSTFLGGNRRTRGYALTVDDSGNAYVTGDTGAGYPVTSGAYCTTYFDSLSNISDVFVTKLNASGTALVYSTYLGGSAVDYGFGISVDGSGNAYVVGHTGSSDYPATIGAFNSFDSLNQSGGFVTKLNPSGSSLVHSTLLYGKCRGVAVDGTGYAYVVGYATSSNYSVTQNASITSVSESSYNVFVTKLKMDPPGPISVTSPHGNGYWLTGTTRDITWVSEGLTNGPVKIELFRGSGMVFDRTIVSSTPNTGSYAWSIPADISDRRDYRIRVTSCRDSTAWDHNDGDFRIVAIGLITMTAPGYREYWTTGTTRDIAWNSDSHVETDVRIELFRESGTVFDRTIVSSAPNIGLYQWTIPKDIPDRNDYQIRVIALNDSTVWGQNDYDLLISQYTSVSELPAAFRVSPPYPNPFNPATTIRLELPRSLHVRAAVYDLLGQEVCVLQDGILSAGAHALVWNGRNQAGNMVSSGVYFYSVRAGEYSAHGKMMFLR